MQCFCSCAVLQSAFPLRNLLHWEETRCLVDTGNQGGFPSLPSSIGHFYKQCGPLYLERFNGSILIFIRRKSFPKRAIPRLAMVERLTLLDASAVTTKATRGQEAWRPLTRYATPPETMIGWLPTRLSSDGVSLFLQLTAGGFLSDPWQMFIFSSFS